MSSKRKSDYDDAEDTMVISQQSSSDTPRRMVKAAAAVDGQMRKKLRTAKYYEEMAKLNESFAQYASDCLRKIMLHSEKREPIPEDLQDFREEIRQYQECASAIKKRFSPSTGAVLTFGTNEFGQLAQIDEIQERRRPALVTTLRNRNVTQVACGALHNVCVNEQGTVFAWGCNDDGSIGDLAVDTAYAPIDVSGFIPSARETAVGLERPQYTWNDLKNVAHINFSDPKLEIDKKYQEMIVSVAAGDCHNLALSNTGRVYFWGSYKDTEGKAWSDIQSDDDPRIHPKKGKLEKPSPRGKMDWPIPVWQLGFEAVEIACGFSFNAAIVKKVENGVVKQKLLTWGMGENGELARPVYQKVKKTPEEIESIPEHVLQSDKYATFNVDKVISDYMPPQEALFADGVDRIVDKVACGGYHLLVLAKESDDRKGQIFSSGLNNYGQLGLSDGLKDNGDHVVNNKDRLTKIDYFDDIEIKDIAAGEHFSLCLDSTGKKLFGFGRSCSGQLGHTGTEPKAGSFEVSPVPIYLEYNSDGTPKENPVIREISCGSNHSFVITNNGDVYSWGYALTGALGLGQNNDDEVVLLPQKIDILKGVNAARKKNNDALYNEASVQIAVGGAQHSAIIATLQ